MATTNTPRAICDAFIKGKKATVRLNSIVLDADTVYSYGHHFPLLVRSGDRFLLNSTPSSPTTNRHRRGALEALHSNGYKRTGVVDRDGRRFEVFSKH